jgi:hypothetical protein
MVVDVFVSGIDLVWIIGSSMLVSSFILCGSTTVVLYGVATLVLYGAPTLVLCRTTTVVLYRTHHPLWLSFRLIGWFGLWLSFESSGFSIHFPY